jgi:hypothetical protein
MTGAGPACADRALPGRPHNRATIATLEVRATEGTRAALLQTPSNPARYISWTTSQRKDEL